MKADADDNRYLQANQNQVYRFTPDGKPLAVLGGGTNLRVADGNKLLATLAVDSRGNVYGTASIFAGLGVGQEALQGAFSLWECGTRSRRRPPGFRTRCSLSSGSGRRQTGFCREGTLSC